MRKAIPAQKPNRHASKSNRIQPRLIILSFLFLKGCLGTQLAVVGVGGSTIHHLSIIKLMIEQNILDFYVPFEGFIAHEIRR